MKSVYLKAQKLGQDGKVIIYRHKVGTSWDKMEGVYLKTQKRWDNV